MRSFENCETRDCPFIKLCLCAELQGTDIKFSNNRPALTNLMMTVGKIAQRDVAPESFHGLIEGQYNDLLVSREGRDDALEKGDSSKTLA